MSSKSGTPESLDCLPYLDLYLLVLISELDLYLLVEDQHANWHASIPLSQFTPLDTIAEETEADLEQRSQSPLACCFGELVDHRVRTTSWSLFFEANDDADDE